MDVTHPPVIIVGCGPGGPDFVIPAARNAVDQADLLVGDASLFELFPESIAERLPLGRDLEACLNEVALRRDLGYRVAVLVTGDPGLYSLARLAIRKFGPGSCQIIPGVSSIQLAFARLGLGWEDARIISAHGRAPSMPLEEMKDQEKIAVLLGNDESVSWACRWIQTLGSDHRLFLCEDLSLPEERVRPVEPGDLLSLRPRSRAILLLIHPRCFL